MVDLYIYYRVRDAQAGELARRVRSMQTELALATGVAGLVKRRPGSPDGVQTWMEIYNDTGAGFDAALGSAVRLAALSELIDGERHTEVFTELNSCA
ncbi:MAG: DUF4936 family protein [Pseudomonadota bacterium]